MTSRRLDVCLIGAGPRGLSVLERLCANAASAAPETAVTVHVVDPFPPGAGQVWRTDQSEHLLMNTVASQVTMFTDESVELRGQLVAGSQPVRMGALPRPHRPDGRPAPRRARPRRGPRAGT